MFRYIVTIIISIFLSYSPLCAIGGQKQAEMLCQKSEYPGVVLVELPNSIGTGQILPGTQGKLVITAQHVTEKSTADNIKVWMESPENEPHHMSDSFVVLEKPTEDTQRIKRDAEVVYNHPTLDLAIIKLKLGFPVCDEQLPKLIDQKFIDNVEQEINNKNKKEFFCMISGYGLTSLDRVSPLMFARETPRKRKGQISIQYNAIAKNLKFYNKNGVDKGIEYKYFMAEREKSAYKNVFAHKGDSGGPVICNNYLLGTQVGGAISRDTQREIPKKDKEQKRELATVLFNEETRMLSEQDKNQLDNYDVEPLIRHHENEFDVLLYWHYGDKFVSTFVEPHENVNFNPVTRNEIELEVKTIIDHFDVNLDTRFHENLPKTKYFKNYRKLVAEIFEIAPDFHLQNTVTNLMHHLDWIRDIYLEAGFNVDLFDPAVLTIPHDEKQVERARTSTFYAQDNIVPRPAPKGAPVERYKPDPRFNPQAYSTDLNLKDQPISNLNDIAEQTKLETLDIRNTKVEHLNALEKLTQLTALYLGGTKLKGFLWLSDKSNLQLLDYSRTSLNTLRGIENLKGLKELWVNDTPLTGLSPLSGLKQLRYLDVSNTKIKSLDGIQGLKKLVILNAAVDQPLSLMALQDVPNLKILFLSEKQAQSESIKQQIQALNAKRPEPFIVKYLYSFQKNTYNPPSMNPNRLNDADMDKIIELIKILPDDLFTSDLNTILREIMYQRELSLKADINKAETLREKENAGGYFQYIFSSAANFLGSFTKSDYANISKLGFWEVAKDKITGAKIARISGNLVQKIADLTFLEKLVIKSVELPRPPAFPTLVNLKYSNLND